MRFLDKLRDHRGWGFNWRPDITNPGTDDAEWTGTVHFQSDDSFEFAPDEDYSVDLIEYVCALHNAAPALIELAKACKRSMDEGAGLPPDVVSAMLKLESAP